LLSFHSYLRCKKLPCVRGAGRRISKAPLRKGSWPHAVQSEGSLQRNNGKRAPQVRRYDPSASLRSAPPLTQGRLWGTQPISAAI
jgi:hypothetical protein